MSSTTGMTDITSAYAGARRVAACPRESLPERLRRWVLGVAWSLKPPRLWGVPAVVWVVAWYYWGPRREELPDPEGALRHPNGLAGICPDLDVETLLAGYRAGLFPFCHIGPMKWWAPEVRMVLRPGDFHMEKNLRRRLRNGHFSVTFDQAFVDVACGCAEARSGRPRLTWLVPDVIDAFAALHDAGYAHSVEVRDGDGNLAGGAFGVAIGKVFFTVSQFTRQRDASKVGFATLNCHLQKWGFVLNDGALHSAHLERTGFQLMPRSQFNGLLARHCAVAGRPGPWAVDDTLDVGNWDPKTGIG